MAHEADMLFLQRRIHELTAQLELLSNVQTSTGTLPCIETRLGIVEAQVLLLVFAVERNQELLIELAEKLKRQF